MYTRKLYDQLLDGILAMPVIDTHEHLPGREAGRDPQGDLFTEYLHHYFNRDLLSAGMPKADMKRVMAKEGSVMDRWLLLEPWWQAASLTGYGRALALAAQGLYGIPQIDRGSIETLYERHQAAMQPGHYRHVLKEKSRILISLLDSDPHCDRDFFRSVFRTEQFLFPETTGYLVRAAAEVGAGPAHSFADWLDACDAAVDQAAAAGCVAYKIGMAYTRSLAVGRPCYHEAEACFNGFADSLHYPDWSEGPLRRSAAFEDYMLHHVLRRVSRHGLPVQIHTGIQEGNGNELRHADPLLLSPLFLQYPDIDFVLMHIGYPWHIQLGVLAKTFPHVYLDMCWSHIISPNASVAALQEWLDSVPCNKICAFGGDYFFVDGVYGHQLLARQNVARALADKIALGLMDQAMALRIARGLFLHNPHAIFKLKAHGVKLPEE